MKALIIGDVVGKPGRTILLNSLQTLKAQHDVGITIVNAENTAGGFSITPSLADEFFAAGIDVLTSGNHIFDKGEIIPYIRKNPRLLRPANYPTGTPGSGLFIGEANGHKIAVLNLLGRLFMPPNVDDPFAVADAAISSIPDDCKIRFVDMHCEATSEKYAMGWYLDGRVSCVVGTHTHVPTADERILEEGTAYITDLGMTGSFSGVIGMDKYDVITRFRQMPSPRAKHSKGDLWLNGVVVEIDESNGLAKSIERIKLTE